MSRSPSYLLVRSRDMTCALPIEIVGETMRPLPLTRLSATPDYLLGLATIRGMAMPVIDLGGLLEGQPSSSITRYVTVRIASRVAALAVEAVIGTKAIRPGALQALDTVMQALPDAIQSVGVLDEGLMVVLQAMRLIPEAWWKELALEEGA